MNPCLYHIWAQNSGEAIDWYEQRLNEAGYVRVNASKGVVVCTGGYARNDEMLAALQPHTLRRYSDNSGIAGATGDGITINEDFQALDAEGNPIEGHYMGGVDSGSYYAGTYPNLSTGNCCGRSVTFGRMLGRALAAK